VHVDLGVIMALKWFFMPCEVSVHDPKGWLVNIEFHLVINHVINNLPIGYWFFDNQLIN
jgi:hypothetical protein